MVVDKTILLPTEPVIIEPWEPGEVTYTRTLLEFLENSGMISGKYELINGRIVSKMGQNSQHNITLVKCLLYLSGIYPKDTVRSQATMEVRQNDRVSNRPEPDVFVLRVPTYTGAPDGDNVLLAIEVSNSTQDRDFDEKVVLYARSGVAEYWVLDLPRRTLTVFRTPDADAGTWASQSILAETQTIAPESAPDATITITDLLTPAD